MKVISYEVHGGPKNELSFSKITFSKLNLIVGDSGAGKTRLLNTFFNGACMAVQKDKIFFGRWEYVFEHQDKMYRWTIETGGDDGEPIKIIEEAVSILQKDGNDEILIQRNPDSFIFMGKDLPKLSANQSSISLLRDDPMIEPLHAGFSSIMRRSFAGGELIDAAAYESVSQVLIKKIKKTMNLIDLFQASVNLNVKLYILATYFKPTFEKICHEFRSIFPFITELEMKRADEFGLDFPGLVPVLAMKEKFIRQKWIPLDKFSSGMIKVLLILTDIFIMPKDGGIYLIDEYENSLGINAINFFPSVLLNDDTGSQFIITSHHPYIIGNVPVKNWIILHRKGSNVMAEQGEEVEKRFGKSKQQAFTQLINDPFYTEGIE